MGRSVFCFAYRCPLYTHVQLPKHQSWCGRKTPRTHFMYAFCVCNVKLDELEKCIRLIHFESSICRMERILIWFRTSLQLQLQSQLQLNDLFTISSHWWIQNNRKFEMDRFWTVCWKMMTNECLDQQESLCMFWEGFVNKKISTQCVDSIMELQF